MRPRGRRAGATAIPLALALTLAGCGSPVPFHRPGEGSADEPVAALGGAAPYFSPAPAAPPARNLEAPAPPPGGSAPVAPPGGPVYAATGAGMIAPVARDMPPRLYVANGRVIDVIDPGTARIVRRLGAGGEASRVVPSWDLRRLWAADTAHGTLVPVGPRSGRRGRPRGVAAPEGLYFTPDGRDALVLAGRERRIDVRDPRTMLPRASVPLPCAARHADFSPDGAFLVASCPAGRLVRVDVPGRRVAGTVRLPSGARPGDLRLSPDGTGFFVADPVRGGVWVVDARRSARPGFVPTAPGARGLAISRDARRLFVVGGGTVTAVEFGTRRIAGRWPLPHGGSPVPGGVSSDGAALWLADASGLVYALSTRTGKVLRKVWVGGRPSGLIVHPQPGRYSLGGSGLYR
ncbi:YncE family protein [Actinomadura graeca]|uniref:YncE family protein n=1 Tax=Actinomadura graeca TaxID=2750812 RepID=A0ABX8QTK8_9ACTN|nr:YncE family protein [Actinomadura graeca]QXJ22082.1 YncE family protein [Actinomadura graeca]